MCQPENEGLAPSNKVAASCAPVSCCRSRQRLHRAAHPAAVHHVHAAEQDTCGVAGREVGLHNTPVCRVHLGKERFQLLQHAEASVAMAAVCSGLSSHL